MKGAAKFNRSIRIYGRVQGVGFRYSAYHYANSIGITGFVKNEPDGCVSMEIRGNNEQLHQMLAWCRQGPVRSRVDEVIAEPAPDRNYSSFEIR